MWHERDHEHPDYARMDYVHDQHHRRFRAYVETHGLPCQACGGRGYHGSYYSYYDPPEPCGWCESTGKVTRWLRGLWLRCLREEKRSRGDNGAVFL